MKPSEFEDHVLPKIEDFLRGMPCVWLLGNNTDNAWEMLVEMWPDNEPGLGLWDEIQDLIRDWIVQILEQQPLDDLREYWEGRTRAGEHFSWDRAKAEKTGEEVYYPPLEQLCQDIAEVLLYDVLRRAEREGLWRQDEPGEEE